ncbi:hypothetical protein BC828DRAFT_382527 [Blastocladiella britannica]|nr:hypothetical protein BC828DRAFT_382527 [Blastocladiella britannica]
MRAATSNDPRHLVLWVPASICMPDPRHALGPLSPHRWRHIPCAQSNVVCRRAISVQPLDTAPVLDHAQALPYRHCDCQQQRTSSYPGNPNTSACGQAGSLHGDHCPGMGHGDSLLWRLRGSHRLPSTSSHSGILVPNRPGLFSDASLALLVAHCSPWLLAVCTQSMAAPIRFVL